MAGPGSGRWWRLTLISLLVAALVALSWSGALDGSAQTGTDVTLKRALTAFALARGLNGVISVAQGTELGLQPMGVGVTLTPGEILDPLNDLVERFSWLALVACASLGTQMLLADIMANAWLNGALTVGAGAYLLALWWPGGGAARAVLLRVCALLVFARFLFVAITLMTAGVDHAVLAERQQAALAEIEATRHGIEALQADAPRAADPEHSLLNRFGAFVDEQRRLLDLEAQLDALSTRVETAVSALINLIVVFVVQTLLVPVASLMLAFWAFRGLWRWSLRGPSPGRSTTAREMR